MEDQSLQQTITITEKAAARLKNIMQNEEPSKKGIRVAIDTGGCSGMSYNITFDGEKKEFDKVYESHGIKILVDPKSLIYIDGTELVFIKEGLNEGFQFNNPKVKDSCGCGESFTV